ncbi:probable E3 ubiquitin-protein ligase ARI7 isoform X1 [Chenopodium quinoa]|uniref:probable E3 ubiquitin-protein ligase ARI7 isoform X1 n=1 Tax=Chenopodium quinoa TaxID=63459 RepID=UPI000B772B3F|nr:probable E3 ubiquitin-protein ligase ARI7 isoform X1 [Chenopodium quinoa]
MECVVQSENCKSITNMKGCPSCCYSFEMSRTHKSMQCSSCEYHFCKLCRASWLDNGSWNGDEFKHTCSKGKQKVENDDREEKGRIAQDSLNKYTNSYNHWMANEMHLQAARQELNKLKNGQRSSWVVGWLLWQRSRTPTLLDQ